MNPLIIIPTYVSSRRRRSAKVTSLYDHTTPLSSPGELPRLLASLQGILGARYVAILVVAERAVEEQAAEKIQVIAAQYEDLRTIVIGANECGLVRQRIEQLGGGRMMTEIGLEGYGAVHNLGLVVACALGFDAAVFVDDDEVVGDPDFMRKAVYGLGKVTRKGIPILAKTGFYFNQKGEYTSRRQDKWYDRYWEQCSAFNEWIESAMRGPRLSRSNHVCGGCMALHREAFKRVAFDPWIARGEDLDYLLNLRMYGSDMWFDNQWSLRHLPPEDRISDGQRFAQDGYRWIYEYRKMEFSRTQIDLLQVKPESLEPYPGPFLQPGITKRIRRTAKLRALGAGDAREYWRAAKLAKTDASAYAERNCKKYFDLQRLWPELMNRLDNDQTIKAALVQSMRWRKSSTENLSQEVRDGYTGSFKLSGGQESLDPGATTEIRLNVAE